MATNKIHTALSGPVNASVIYDDADSGFLMRALGTLGTTSGALIVSNDVGFLSALPMQNRLCFERSKWLFQEEF